MYLAPYSPDLNPIEEAFSKVKGLLRRAEARTGGALVEAVGWVRVPDVHPTSDRIAHPAAKAHNADQANLSRVTFRTPMLAIIHDA